MGIILQDPQQPFARSLTPPAVLANHVRSAWISDYRHSGSECRIIPDACTELIVQVQPDAPPMVFVGGVMSRSKVIPNDGSFAVGLSLQPAVTGAWLGFSPGQLRDGDVPLGELGHHWPEQLDLRSPAAVVAALYQLVGARINASSADPDPLVAGALTAFYRGAGLAEVVDAAGISNRHLRRRFDAASGLSPKSAQRLARLHTLLACARREVSPHWAQLAADGGYYDQAHLVRDVRRLTGLSPRQLHTRYLQPRPGERVSDFSNTQRG